MEHGTWNMKHETKNTKLKNLYAHQFVISPTPRPVINVNGVFILGLPVAAVHRFQACLAVACRQVPVLKVVSTLLEQ